jgi:sortase (surface protein transpeptidase)
LGRAGAFARIDELHAGATISIRNTNTGHEVHYVVRQLVDYPLAATTERAVIARMYGAGPAAGETPQRSADGLAHLTLVTCAGTFDHSIQTHDHRLAVYATVVA